MTMRKKVRATQQDLCNLQQAVHVAQKVGTRMGGREILLRPLPRVQKDKALRIDLSG